MTLLLKAPDSRLDYGVDWGTDYLSGDALASIIATLAAHGLAGD